MVFQVPERKKVLISAYACHPGMGSEMGMGWNWVSRIALHHDVWLLTEENRCAPVITEYIEHHPELRDSLHVIPVPRERYLEGLWSHFYYLTYMLWHKKAYQAALKLHNEVGFDLAHQLNMIGYREPGYLWRLPVPFIWGPIGGHAQFPWSYLPMLGVKGGWHYGLRNILNKIQMRVNRRVREAVRQSACLISATVEDQLAIEKYYGAESKLLNEQGCKAHVGEVVPGQGGDKVLHVVWSGLFLPRKCLPLALRAVQMAAREIKVRLHIIGSGQCDGKWKGLAEDLEVNSLCTWYGKLEHAQALEAMRQGDVLLFTSLLEGTPAVVMESLEMGLPVICHDICGMKTAINESCGIKIPVGTPERSVRRISEILIDLQHNRDKLARLKRGAMSRAKELAWENKVTRLLEQYDKCLMSDQAGSL